MRVDLFVIQPGSGVVNGKYRKLTAQQLRQLYGLKRRHRYLSQCGAEVKQGLPPNSVLLCARADGVYDLQQAIREQCQ